MSGRSFDLLGDFRKNVQKEQVCRKRHEKATCIPVYSYDVEVLPHLEEASQLHCQVEVSSQF